MTSAPALFEGAIFDVDGVLVDSPHERAWRKALHDLMEGPWQDIRPRTTWSSEGFTSLLYQTLVSGKPRSDGARAVLEHFHVPDDDEETRVSEYAARKQHEVESLIDSGAFTAYPDGVRFVIDTKARGLRLAAASSSKNAARMLRQIRLDRFVDESRSASSIVRPGATLLDAFDVDVSGREFAHGKPHPEMFLTAAAELAVSPGSVVVVEDAAAGVRAAKAGGMAAIGIARAGDGDLLHHAGADLVVNTLDDVDLSAFTPTSR